MASYALPAAVSPPLDFETRRSFFLSNPHGRAVQENSNLPRKFLNKVQTASQRQIYPASPSDEGVPPGRNEFMPAKTRPRGESDLGRPKLRPRAISTAYTSSRPSSTLETTINTVSEAASSRSLPIELLTAILIPLPFLLSSAVNQPASLIVDNNQSSAKVETATEILDNVALSSFSLPSPSFNFVHACAIASGSLVLVGIIGRILDSCISPHNRKSQATQEKSVRPPGGGRLSVKKLRRLGLRAISITLPFLATAEIGGVRTGAFLLASTVGGLLAPDIQTVDQISGKPWKRAFAKQRWTFGIFILCLLCDLFVLRKDTALFSTLRGYLLLANSMLFLQLPNTLSSSSTRHSSSPLIGSRREADCTLAAGAVLGLATFVLAIIFSATPTLTLSSLALSLASIVSAAGLLVWSRPCSLRSRRKPGLILGLLCCIAFSYVGLTTAYHLFAMSGLIFLVYAAVQVDTRSNTARKASSSNPTVRRHSDHHHHQPSSMSPVTYFLLRYTEGFPMIHSILLDKESRRIVYFMGINLGFMFIQTFYALMAGSLGLLSDSIHMLFDCVGLFAGLIASVMSKWPPNAQFPYGYGKVETLSGLGNGIFLIIISVEIIWESFERFMEGAELHRLSELLAVSIGGLAVNCIGLIFIGHSHHGHSHAHSHAHSHGHVHEEPHLHSILGHHDENIEAHEDSYARQNAGLAPKLAPKVIEVEKPKEGALGSEHHHHHTGHGHANENMAGIYLHILADTMGSVAVIASTLLTKYTGWSGWDPIASCIIAVLIIIASCPLVVGSARQLLLTVPSEVEYALRSTLQELSGLRGVSAYAVPRFWLDDTENQPVGQNHDVHDKSHNHDQLEHDHNQSEKHECSHSAKDSRQILGVIHVIATHGADLEEVRIRVGEFFQDRSMDTLVQVEREEQSQCWCGGALGGGGSHTRSRSTVAM